MQARFGAESLGVLGVWTLRLNVATGSIRKHPHDYNFHNSSLFDPSSPYQLSSQNHFTHPAPCSRPDASCHSPVELLEHISSRASARCPRLHGPMLLDLHSASRHHPLGCQKKTKRSLNSFKSNRLVPSARHRGHRGSTSLLTLRLTKLPRPATPWRMLLNKRRNRPQCTKQRSMLMEEARSCIPTYEEARRRSSRASAIRRLGRSVAQRMSL